MTNLPTREKAKARTKSIMKGLSKTSVRAIALSLLFIVSSIGASVLINPAAAAPNSTPSAAAPVAAATPLTQAQANWEFPNGNAFNQDYNPQNQINSSNVQYLGLSWMYPLPTTPTSLTSLGGLYSGASVQVSVLVVNGTAFATTEYDEILAFNVANGNVLWTYLTPLAPNQTQGQATGPVPLHSHDGNEWFTTATFSAGVSGPTLWFQGQNNRVYAVNALTGKEELHFSDFTGLSMVAGNSPTSFYNGIGASNIVIDQKLGILVSGHDAETMASNGRGFFAGWDLNANPPSMKWITYSTPPQSGGNVPVDPNWAISDVKNMSGAYTFFPGKGGTNGYTTPAEVAGGVLMNTNDNLVVNWKSLSAAQLNASLYNDWGQAFQTQQCLAIDAGMSTGSTGSGWGGAWIVGSGQTAGMVFVNTNNKDPYVGPCTPGPDLWSAALLALNVTTGKAIWGFQANAHDIWDWDCSWFQAIGNETINAVNTEVIFKTCKNGYLYEINALTGDLIWAFSPPSGVATSAAARCSVCYMWDPLNQSQMHFDYPTALTNCKPAFTIACESGAQPSALFWPSAIAGYEGEQAYDPATGQVYSTTHMVPAYPAYLGLNASTYFTSPGMAFGAPCPACGFIDNNSTTWDVDAATGHIVWHYTQPSEGYRGKTVVSGGLVYLTESSGSIVILNALNGNLVRDYYIGAPMDEGVSFGASVNGTESVLLSVGVCDLEAITTCPGTTPGNIVALTLMNVPTQLTSAKTQTVTSTATSTITSTTTAPGTVVTTTVTGPGGQIITTTTTITGPGGSVITSTLTSVSTAGGGVSSTTLYGVAAVAVIFIIATGYLAMRGRKPVS
jgi:outer membrane protein assembly factor BamB